MGVWSFARAPDQLRDAFAGRGAARREMIVLHHDTVEEPEAVVVAAALADRVFFEHTEAGRRLARIQQPRGRGTQRADIGLRLRRHARESLQKIQERPLGRQ